MLNLDKCAQTHIQLFAESGNWSALYRTRQNDHLHWNMSKYAVIYAHNGKSNRLRFSEPQRVYFYLCALTISTKHAFIKSRRKKRTFGFEQAECFPHWLKYSIYRKLWISPILKNEIIWIENNYFHYKIPKDVFLSKGASNDEMASHDAWWSKMLLFSKHWELLVTPPRFNFSLMLCMVKGHLCVNVCLYIRCVGNV